MNNKSRRSRRKYKSGSATIEAVIAIPILLTLAIGFFEYGWHIHNNNILHSAARRGARSAAYHENSNAEVTAAVVTALQDSISIEASDVNVRLANLNNDGTEEYTINSLSENENGDPVRVIVTVQNSHFQGVFNMFVASDENLSASATMHRSR